MSSERSEHSRDSSLERKSASPSARGSSKAVDSDHSEKHSTSRHLSRKKKRKHHHHHHHRHQSKSPESLEHKRSKEKKKHKSKKKHKRHHAHDESRPSKERDEEELLSHLMEEDKQARDSVVGSELEGGGDMEGKSHDTVMEGLTGTETVVMEPELNFNTREDVPAKESSNVLVNNEPTVEQHDDHVMPPPLALVGVASPQPANQSATKA